MLKNKKNKVLPTVVFETLRLKALVLGHFPLFFKRVIIRVLPSLLTKKTKLNKLNSKYLVLRGFFPYVHFNYAFSSLFSTSKYCAPHNKKVHAFFSPVKTHKTMRFTAPLALKILFLLV